jgi:hypothetical protein
MGLWETPQSSVRENHFMTILQILDESGITHSKKDRLAIGRMAKKAALMKGKRDFHYISEGDYFVIDYEDEYREVIQERILVFYTHKAERASR